MNRVFRGVLLLFAATRLEAQKQPMIVDSCIYRIPAKSLTRVPVFLQATADSSVKVVLPGADLFAQSVAFQIRDMLGAAGPHLHLQRLVPASRKRRHQFLMLGLSTPC